MPESETSKVLLRRDAASSTREEAGELAIELCRDLYDRFVMGGWQPLDAHDRTTMKIEDWADSREQRYREALKSIKLTIGHIIELGRTTLANENGRELILKALREKWNEAEQLLREQ